LRITKKERTLFRGKYIDHGKPVEFDKPGFERKKLDADSGLGLKVTYKRFDEGLWVPVTYGGEFKLKALFFYSRRVGLSLENSGFQRAVVDSVVNYADLR
jgi:hypothetical protein